MIFTGNFREMNRRTKKVESFDHVTSYHKKGDPFRLSSGRCYVSKQEAKPAFLLPPYSGGLDKFCIMKCSFGG